jgi:hypothetical protein
MPENEAKKDGRLADGGSQAIPNIDLDRQVSLPSIPLSNSPDPGKADSQAEFTFDQKVKSYGEALKTELAKNTRRNFHGEFEWEPYRINIDHIPTEYHERLAHYLLQAYKLPEAERHVAYNAPVFHSMDRTALAQALLARGLRGVVALGENLYNFKGVDESVILEPLLRGGYIEGWIDKVDFFSPSAHRTIVMAAAKQVINVHVVLRNLHRFTLTEDDQRAMVKTILAGQEKDPDAPVVDSNAVESLVNILHLVKGVDHGEVLLESVKCSARVALSIAAQLHRYSSLPYESLAEACSGLKNNPAWQDGVVPRRLHMLTIYLSAYPLLDDKERAQRLLKFNPIQVLDHIEEYPSLRHLDVALACLKSDRHYKMPSFFWQFPSHMAKLSLPTLKERRTLAEALMESPYGCEALIRSFEKFQGVDPSAVADKILERDAKSFLNTGLFLGFTPSEMLVRLLRKGPLEATPVSTEEEETNKWIQLGGHTSEVAAALMREGLGQLVIENPSRFVGLSHAELQGAAVQASLLSIHHGRVDTAQGFLKSHEVPVERLNQKLIEHLRVDMSSQSPSPEALLRIAGVAAWSLYYPELLRAEGVAQFLGPYRSLFGSQDPEQLERNARQRFLENLVSRGVPILIQSGWFHPRVLPSLATILPSFLESTTGSLSAWAAHEANLQVNLFVIQERQKVADVAFRRALRDLGPEAEAQLIHKRAEVIWKVLAEPMNREIVDPIPSSQAQDGGAELSHAVTELKLLRRFYADFGIIQAPALYSRRYRSCQVPALGGEGLETDPWKLASLQRELKSLHNTVAKDDPVDVTKLADEHLEYLSGWIRIRDPQNRHHHSTASNLLGYRLRKYQEASNEGSIQPKDARLLPRRMRVHLSLGSSPPEKKWTEALTTSYERTKETLEQCRDLKARDLFVQERSSVRRFIDQQLQERRDWLAAAEALSPGSKKALSGREQVVRLVEYSHELDKIQDPQRLIEFLCRVKGPTADRFKGSVVKLSLCLGFERVLHQDEFLESLANIPTERSVRRIVEFIANEVRDAALRPLERDPKILHIAEKCLCVPEFKRALVTEQTADPGGRERFPQGSPTEEIIVLPTRGILAELAGFFSEACWTDKENLMRDHPNATALVFLKRKTETTDLELASGSVDLSDAKLLGACYMLQVQDIQGNEVLALRGINPRDKICDHLDTESFIEGLLDDVMMPYADALGAKKIVIPFDELGHAQTNRIPINKYLHARYAEGEYIPLDTKGPSSLFNDRLIFDKCRLVRLRPPRQ